MTVTSGPNLGLLIDAAPRDQYYNEYTRFLRGIDGLMQCRVKDKDLTAPPGAPVNGDMYIVGPAPTGAWATHAGKLARYFDVGVGAPGWEFYTPKAGWSARVQDEIVSGIPALYVYSGSAWVSNSSVAPVVDMQTFLPRPRIINLPAGFDWPGIAGLQFGLRSFSIRKLPHGGYKLDWPSWAPPSFLETQIGRYYVSSTGSDSDDGSELFPFRTIPHALSQADAREIIVRPGVYASGVNWTATPASSVINIRVEGEGRVIVGDIYRSWTFTENATYAGLYEYTGDVATVVNCVVMNRYDEFGTNMPLVLFADFAALAAAGTPGFAIDSGTLYVRMPDDSQPNSNTLWVVKSGTAPQITAGTRYYIMGFEFWGCANGFELNSITTHVVFIDCDFAYSGGNGLDADNVQAGVVLRNCRAFSNRLDGFNYHDNGTNPTFAIEDHCVAFNNGFNNASQTSNNGSTQHDSGRIIRVGGVYGPSFGPVIADIENSMSFNVGCVAYGSMTDGGIPASWESWAGNGEDGATMWLEDCYGYGSDYSLYAHDGGKIYVRNASMDGPIFEETAGDISTF